MIDALIAGKLYGQPQQRTGKSGKPFVTAKARVATGDGDSLFVNAIAFGETVCAALLALDEGDSVALAGTVTPKVWIDKDGQPRPALDMVAAQVLTPYHVTRKRTAMSPPQDQ
jgi:single-stranded DNA-binding protein